MAQLQLLRTCGIATHRQPLSRNYATFCDVVLFGDTAAVLINLV